ncbi:hypothetical protein [uncultured Cytophaga sp.]|uniref:hypothetical protein n=1 Tax=uncultured Cytophaga sp. TaxID=160238 RepID=UPI00262FEF7A|nr:hypothetical protein [uncultured Cytophaga sp.]
MRFESIDAYENFFKPGSDSNRTKLERSAAQNQTHPSMLRTSNLRTSSTIVDSLYPDFLKAILNADAITQIGDYLIKVDMENGKVLVLKSEDKQDYNDLVTNNVSNAKIMVYSTDDDVLDLLANGLSSSNERTTLFCGRKAGPPNKDSGYEYYNNSDSNWRLDCKVVNQNAGIYFSLQAKANKQKYSIEDNDHKTLFLDYYFAYTPKCKDGAIGYGTDKEIDKSDINKRIYESSRGLESYLYTVRFRLDNGYATRYYQISFQ